ncbi:conserved hypothetical protein, uncharacterized acr, yggu family [Heliomicrobium modesticaldum Ice1]|uniref:UPF0235 protein Helmi_20270 n=1 Tax=Heliobacterium modesticaldum (strain ATCC 51547 / Ice1) TaxID=498761 RepID=Y2027_HELMI|nr:DUF167 domain-containing protein [Heliomicrobium modesticaldum]B0TGP1.1 RecName: Full=UPF0235 protein Helmi_20270 [Heliomicrobium modesticaldum Ice1]ABZ84652.1 conserved hypothetical protein, uncharacterized acr, yggu family [Heliomicrobium modesticaldum Ice1]
MGWIQEQPGGSIRFRIRVQPRASKNEVCGLLDDALKVRLTAPPVDGEANAACLQFIAKTLGLSRSQVRLVAGETSRLKTLEVEGVSAEDLRKRFDI